MWTEVWRPGFLKMMGRKAVVLVDITSMKGSSSLSHMMRVPPMALLLIMGSSGSRELWEFNWQQYSPCKYWKTWLVSHWYSWGSLRHTKEILAFERMSLSKNILFLIPSQFHVNAVKVSHLVALASWAKLSELGSLNSPHQIYQGCAHQQSLLSHYWPQHSH